MTTAIDRSRPAPGSLKDVATRQGKSIEEVFADIQAVLMVDTSGSMTDIVDPATCESRWDRQNKEILAIQAKYPGLIGVIAFGGTVDFVYDGHIPEPGGGTPMADALKMGLVADGGVDLWLLSDGHPDNDTEALAVASQYTSRINTIFIGNSTPGNQDWGEEFLKKLAVATGGVSSTSVNFESGTLTKVTKLLTAPKGPIAL